MTRIFNKIREAWQWTVLLAIDKTFIFTYPLVILTVIAFATKSVLVVIALGVWFGVVILNVDEK